MTEDNRMMGLTLATILGLCVALLDRFALDLPDQITWAALGLAYLAGGVPAAVEALGGKGGGGRPDMAQGGGADVALADAALKAVEAALGA